MITKTIITARFTVAGRAGTVEVDPSTCDSLRAVRSTVVDAAARLMEFQAHRYCKSDHTVVYGRLISDLDNPGRPAALLEQGRVPIHIEPLSFISLFDAVAVAIARRVPDMATRMRNATLNLEERARYWQWLIRQPLPETHYEMVHFRRYVAEQRRSQSRRAISPNERHIHAA
ncbi:MAG: hypothetical protein ACREPQ_14380 [Rhodanobacter sp.]